MNWVLCAVPFILANKSRHDLETARTRAPWEDCACLGNRLRSLNLSSESAPIYLPSIKGNADGVATASLIVYQDIVHAHK